MASFNTHVAGGVVAGIGISAIGFYTFGLSLIQSFAVFVMGAVGGILPDLDSDSGKPLALLFGILSVLLPALLLNRWQGFDHLSPEFLVVYFVSTYLFINHFVCGVVKKMTVHRGIMHSLPFAVISGEAAYLFFAPSGRNLALIVGLAVFTGCLVHLLLDEFHSFKLKYGFMPVVNRSAGTALKLTSDNGLATVLIYLLMIGMSLDLFWS